MIYRHNSLCSVLMIGSVLAASAICVAGDLDVRIADNGQIGLAYKGETIVKYEMLQLIDTRPGWTVVFHYGRSKALQRKDTEGDITISESVPNVLSYTKRISARESGVSWDIAYETAKGTRANRNYYFIDIPRDVLAGAFYRGRLADGKKVSGEVPTSAAQKRLAGITSLTFFTPKHRIEWELGGEDVTWLLLDWTATVHKSYRLRIENELDGEPVRARLNVKLRIGPSSPTQVEAVKRQVREEAEALARARLIECGFEMRRPLRIGAPGPIAREVAQYGKFELCFTVEGTFTNPFDPDQIDVVGQFRTPSGKQINMPAFFCQDFTRGEDGIRRLSTPVWKVRFAPVEVGRHTYRVMAKNKGRQVASGEGSFTCTARKHPGYIRVGKANPLYCEFENGEPYFPSGINVFVGTRLGSGIPTDRLDQCERWMDALADHDGNFIRLRMDSWWNAIEMTPDEACGYFGLGYYHQQTCWEIDRIYDKAAERGIYVMHCMDNANGNVNHRANTRKSKRNAWRVPYNLYLKENGGVCDDPLEFWTHAEARRYTRNKLRYVVARWGWHPRVMCWEFHNETSCRADMIEAAAGWHRDMARYLRRIDPYDHPITTSLMGDHKLAHQIWELPEMEIIQYHFYSRDQMTPRIMALTREGMAEHGKPFFVGEYGVGPMFRPGNCDYDKTGIHMHNGMWAATFAGGCGAGAIWYIRNYVEPFDLWSRYRAHMGFAKRVPWNASDLVRCEVDDPTFEKLPGKLHYSDLKIPTSAKYAFKKSPKTDFVIEPNGTVRNWEMLRPQLNVAEGRKSPPTFHVTLDQPAQFVIRVTRSIGDETNKLLVHLDDKLVAEEPFPAGKEFSPQSEHVPKYENWRTPYDKEVVIDVPAGKHRIKCEAVGKDRLEVGYQLRGAIAFERAHPTRAYGFRTSRAAYLWFQNTSSTWWTAWEGKQPIPLSGLTTKVHGLPDGGYRVEWHDTWAGEITGTDTATSRDGVLTLMLSELRRDVACVVEPK